jgi:hypothetical protein
METKPHPRLQSIEDGKTGSVGEEDTAKAAPSTAQQMDIDVDVEVTVPPPAAAPPRSSALSPDSDNQETRHESEPKYIYVKLPDGKNHAYKARPGDVVEFQGLQSAAYLNGTKGYLVEFINNEQQWVVLRHHGGKSVKAKPQNLKLLTQTASTEVTHQELTCMTLGALQQLCKLKGLSRTGKMSILIGRFLDAQLRGFPTKKKPTTGAERTAKSRANQSDEKKQQVKDKDKKRRAMSRAKKKQAKATNAKRQTIHG